MAYGVHALVVGGYLYLVALGFYLSSVGCRHFNLAAGAFVVAGFYGTLAFQSLTGWWLLSMLAAVVAAGGMAWLYLQLSRFMHRRGARSEQLLIVSLAVLGLVGNGISLVAGSGSRSFDGLGLWRETVHFLGVDLRRSELLLLAMGVLTAALALGAWKASLLGKKLRAMRESRVALALRGQNVAALEGLTVGLGGLILGLAGVLWGAAYRVSPKFGLEASVVGTVAYLVSPLFADGPAGLLVAVCGLTVSRVALSLLTEGDWSMTGNLLVLCVGLGVGALQRLRGGSGRGHRWTS